MQHRCYRCSFLMHDGIPPLEALSQDQAGEVGPIEESDSRYVQLAGTPYEGMSIYSFCAFCVLAIRDFPSAMFGGQHTSGHTLVRCSDREGWGYLGMDCVLCGEIYRKFNTGKGFTRFDETLLNRSGILHMVEMLYKNADLTLIRALYTQEI